MSELILASSSKYRAQLLDKLEIHYEMHAPDINEAPLPGESAHDLVKRLAQQKAHALQAPYPNHLIIGSDQAGEYRGKIISKPLTHEAAFQQLLDFSGDTIIFYTGICLLNTLTHHTQCRVISTQVHFRHLNKAQIENYLQREKPYDCAGSFKAEGLGISLFTKIESDDPTALIGLPLIELTTMLINEGMFPGHPSDD